MMRRVPFLAPLAGAALAACAQAAPPPEASAARTATPPPIAVERLKEDTRTLASDEFEGRAPGTPGEEKTIAYLSAEMAEAGLQPGNNGSWYQDVPLVEITVDPSTELLFETPKGPITLEYNTDMVASTKREGSRVSVDNSDVVFVGYGINAPERGWNDYAGLDVKGKTVIILVNDPDWETQGLEGPFDGRAMTYYGRWTYKYEEAARQGAAAAIIVHQTEPASYPWSVVQTSWTGPQIDAVRPDRGASRSAIEGWITLDAARKLFQAAGQDFGRLQAAAKQPGFKAVPLPIEMSTTAQLTTRRSTSRNVVGILPGQTRPDEYVLYMAHWDHLGRCQPDATGDDICNGAIDNATGTAGLLELARAHVTAGPADRSLVFLAVTAEESGLLGSDYYAANPIYPLAQTVGGINMDAFGMKGRTADLVVVGAGKSELEDYLARAVAAQSRRIEPEPTPEAGFFYRSDHFSLAKRGVPMLYAESGVDVRGKGRAYGQQLDADYTENRYHAPGDDYDPNWDWSGVVEDLNLFYRVGRELAQGDAWPNWYETAEFRAARDQSRGGATTPGAP